MTNVQTWRRRLAITALVLGSVGLAATVVVVTVEQYILGPWFAIPTIVAGPLLIVLALVCLVLRALARDVASKEGSARSRYVAVFVVIAVLLGVLVLFLLIAIEYLASALAYCIPIGFNGCAP